jgi:Zn-dependent M28 family amino/carboxypeptidase
MRMRPLVIIPALLTVLVAPAAEAQAQQRTAKFRVATLRLSDASVNAGDTIRVSGRVLNRARRRAAPARISFTLRRTRAARRGTPLGSKRIRRTRGGRARGYSRRVLIPTATTPGTYYLTACVRRLGARRPDACARRRIVVLAVTSPNPTPPDTRSPSEKLRTAITQEGLLSHLRAFQQIADDNGGNRASGFQGYGASVQYALTVLRAAGYTPTTQVFSFVVFTEHSTPVFERTAPPPTRSYVHDTEFATMSYSASGDVEAPLTPVDLKLAEADRGSSSSGCEDTDFAAFPAGDVALIQRGGCTFYEKVLNAQEAGASGVVVFNQGNDPGRLGVVAGTLGEEAQDGDATEPDITIPTLGTSFAIGEELATEDASGDDVRVHVLVDASNDRRQSTNVLADTPGGNAGRVVMFGGHLDSVQEGPGINDNGSGSALVLEMAVQMQRLGIQPVNRMRFALWGAEESGLVGATRYVAALSAEDLGRIAAYLNFDMLASPNHGKFIYDGDFSDSTPPATAPDVNEGAARIEQEFVNYFNSQGVPTEPTAFDGRSDYKPFQDNLVPSGGLFSGAEQAKTPAQAVKWGGVAGTPFDPNYHEAGDTIDNIDAPAYEQFADGGAHVGAVLAHDASLRNVGGGMVSPQSRRTTRRAARSDGRASERLGGRLQR